MDILPENDGLLADTPTLLSYDQDIAYEDQVPTTPAPPSLADRISRSKVYLLSESNVTRGSKRKREDEEEQIDTADERELTTDDSSRRPNALLLQGPPISHLPTKLIFEYVTHFDAKPLGLEWIDDTTCVLLFASSAAATAAFSQLQRTPSETPDERGFVLAKSIPMAFWPPKQRIDASLGKGEGLKGALHLRWAEVTDVKKRGARSRSEFYRKHGVVDGQPGGEARKEEAQEAKRRRREELDDELDAFLRSESPDEESRSATPPSKMRADYVEKGREMSLLQRTSLIRGHYPDNEDINPWKNLEPRITSMGALTGRSRRPPRDGARDSGWRGTWNEDGVMRSQHGRTRKSQQELDDELDAFLKERE